MVKRWLAAVRGSTLARNSLWMFTGQGLSLLLQVGYFILIARLLGASQYGLLAGTFAMISMLSQYSSIGTGYVFLRYISASKDDYGVYWGNILAVTTLCGALLSCILVVLGKWLLPHVPLSTVFLLAISDCVFGQLVVCCSQVYQTFERMKITATLNLMTNCARTLCAGVLLITLRHCSAGLWAAAIFGIALVSSFAGLTVVWRTFGRPHFNFGLMRKRLFEGFIFSLSGSTTAAYNDLDKAMLGHYGMTQANAVYSMAYRMIDVATIPIRSIHAAATPTFFRKGATGAHESAVYARLILKRTAPLAVCAVVGLLVFSPLVPLVVGKSFGESVNVLRWLAVIPILRCFHLSAGNAIAGAGYQKFRLLSQASVAAMNFGINCYLIPHYSWRGAAISSILADGLLAVLNWTVLGLLARRDMQRQRSNDLTFATES